MTYNLRQKHGHHLLIIPIRKELAVHYFKTDCEHTHGTIFRSLQLLLSDNEIHIRRKTCAFLR